MLYGCCNLSDRQFFLFFIVSLFHAIGHKHSIRWLNVLHSNQDIYCKPAKGSKAVIASISPFHFLSFSYFFSLGYFIFSIVISTTMMKKMIISRFRHDGREEEEKDDWRKHSSIHPSSKQSL